MLSRRLGTRLGRCYSSCWPSSFCLGRGASDDRARRAGDAVKLLASVASAIMLAWTNPSGHPITRYEQQRKYPGGSWSACALWVDAAASGNKTSPSGPGTDDSGWVYIHPSPSVPALYRVRACNGTACGPWSNQEIVSAASRWVAASVDTPYYLLRAGRCSTCYSDPAWSQSGLLGWSLAPGDSVGFQIMSCETVNRAERSNSCRLFPGLGWPLRGGYLSCP